MASQHSDWLIAMTVLEKLYDALGSTGAWRYQIQTLLNSTKYKVRLPCRTLQNHVFRHTFPIIWSLNKDDIP